MIIYLKYPRKRGFFKWDELSLLARVLGFPGNLFRCNFPKFITCQNDGISSEVLLSLVCDHTYLNAAVDATANFHFFSWNLAVIRKCIVLLNKRLLTFRDIHLVRVAFFFYEGVEAKGIPLDFSLLQKALKLCGRMISTQKMMQRTSHMLSGLDEIGYLHLTGFIDLVLWSDTYDKNILEEISHFSIEKDKSGCFKMNDFNDILGTVDDRLIATLDRQYQAEECSFAETKTQKRQRQNNQDLYVNQSYRQVKLDRLDYDNLIKTLASSSEHVRQSRFDHKISPLRKSCSDLKTLQQDSLARDSQSQCDANLDATKTSGKTVDLACQSDTGSATEKDSGCPRYYSAAVVSKDDTEKTKQEIVSLKFDMVTLDTKYQLLLQNALLDVKQNRKLMKKSHSGF